MYGCYAPFVHLSIHIRTYFIRIRMKVLGEVPITAIIGTTAGRCKKWLRRWGADAKSGSGDESLISENSELSDENRPK